MADIIKHRGIVENIKGSHIQVRIVQTSACSACSVKGHCNASESKEKLIDVFDMKASSYQIGEEVMLYGTTSMGMQAVFMAFGVPFLVMLVTLFLFMHLTDGDELKSALVALLALVPYYLIIYMCRNKLSKKFSFTVKPIKNN
ncbi:SoxR reducing system RseC family protein [Phocaeicola sp.]|uniref:SoxR reducing system RseC family protein n=1 Tax=Phocaeicola sp. TaxID=2773926 RepID=UPI0023D69537|nr:SoxR reducing system RseC family protein [Phocaeicola sp.]MDE5677030.1 SoxR reducing system RseC family protein [Phocaeicola sp.]